MGGGRGGNIFSRGHRGCGRVGVGVVLYDGSAVDDFGHGGGGGGPRRLKGRTASGDGSDFVERGTRIRHACKNAFVTVSEQRPHRHRRRDQL